MLVDILHTAVFAMIGIILMVVGNFLIDAVIPGDFREEIKRGNRAVAWLCAGSFIGIGQIVSAAVAAPVAAIAEEAFLHGLQSSVLYSLCGIVFFIVGFFLVNAYQRKYSLAEEIMRGNTAAGIIVFGIFIGLSFVISGAIR